MVSYSIFSELLNNKGYPTPNQLVKLLGLMGQSGENNSELERKSIDIGNRGRYNEMEGTESSWDGSVRLRDCIVLTAEARPAETVDVSIPCTAQRMVTLIIQ